LARRHAHHSHDAHRDQEALDGKTVDWMEKVSDEQYRKMSSLWRGSVRRASVVSAFYQL